MNVWVCIPSKRPFAEVRHWMSAWRERGYKIALQRDPEDLLPSGSDILVTGRYRGYAVATNLLIRLALQEDPCCQWIVAGGDDVYPDPKYTGSVIGNECSMYFKGTFGVMQPTGDKWGDKTGPYSERVCGSPWIGREFAQRVNQGDGPLWPAYTHMGVDEELQHVALKLGVLWQRNDLTHEHRHWGRPAPGQKMGHQSNMPEFLKQANSQQHWDAYKKLFAERQAQGFPGHEPLVLR
jgi:hypothetical protein